MFKLKVLQKFLCSLGDEHTGEAVSVEATRPVFEFELRGILVQTASCRASEVSIICERAMCGNWQESESVEGV